MLNIKRALKQDRLLRAMTGLNLQAFDALLPIFTHWYEKNVLAERTSPLRQRAIGGVREYPLTTQETERRRVNTTAKTRESRISSRKSYL
jgi:hypothetical protein